MEQDFSQSFTQPDHFDSQLRSSVTLAKLQLIEKEPWLDALRSREQKLENSSRKKHEVRPMIKETGRSRV